MNFKNSLFLFAVLISMCSCGGDGGDDDNVGVIAPSNLVFEVNIVGQDETHPNGDGSGTITLNFSADNATVYKINMGDGETKETSANELTYTYSGEGLKTFEINVSAYNGFEFISSNISVTVQIGPSTGLNLVWADEFNGNGAINSDNWFHQTQLPAGGNWYNNEVQHYTNRTDNSYVSDGTLKIVAKKESFTNEGYTKPYTSARLNSKFAFTYGRIDVRAKLPIEAGTWPAIWMLGKNINEDGGFWDDSYGTTPWPACGEIDIMERGIFPNESDPINFINSALHTPCCNGGNANGGGIVASDVQNEFHIYSVNWSPDEMTFLLDDVVFYIYNPTVKDADTWPFTQDQYILLNIAMGGIAGAIDPTFTESTMEIDYVRVYQ